MGAGQSLQGDRRFLAQFADPRPHLQITTLPFFLVDTDFIALVPEGLAKRLGVAIDLLHRPLAIEEPPVRSVLAWSPTQDADPAHRWFRERVTQDLVPTLRRD